MNGSGALSRLAAGAAVALVALGGEGPGEASPALSTTAREQSPASDAMDAVVAALEARQPELAPGSMGQAPESGYYFSVSTHYGGSHLAEIPPEHRLAHVGIEWESQADHAAVAEEARLTGRTVVYSAHEIAFGFDGTRYRLRSDWRARWEAQLPKVEEFRKRGVLHSIYLADEPYAHGLRLAELQVVTDWLHDRNFAVMVVEVWGAATWQRPAYDYFGLTCYTQDTTGNWSVDWVRCERQSRLSHANVVVGQSFNSTAEIPDPRFAAALARRLRAKALLWFMWPTVEGVGYGSIDDPAGTACRQFLARQRHFTNREIEKQTRRPGST